MKKLWLRISGLIVGILLQNMAVAGFYEITAYIGNARVYLCVQERTAAGDLVGKPVIVTSGSDMDGNLWGEPTNMKGNDSPLTVFEKAAKQAFEKLGLDRAQQHSGFLYVSIAGYEAYHSRAAVKDPANFTGSLKQAAESCPVEVVSKRDFFGHVMTYLLGTHGVSVKPENVYMNGDQLVAGRIAQLAVGSPAVTSQDLTAKVSSLSIEDPSHELICIHVATCVTPYSVVGKAEPRAITPMPSGHKGVNGGQFQLGTITKTQLIAPLFVGKNVDEMTYDECELLLKEKSTKALLKVMGHHPYSQEYRHSGRVKRYPHTLIRWSKGFTNESGRVVCSIANGTVRCSDQDHIFQVTEAQYIEASQNARELEMQVFDTLNTVIRQAVTVYQPTQPGVVPKILVVGEFACSCEQLDEQLKARLPEYGERLQVVTKDSFLALLPKAGHSLIEQQTTHAR